MSYTVKQVIVIRHDLNMRKGKFVAQGSHASLSAYKEAVVWCPDHVFEWERTGTAKIVLRVESEEELLQIHSNARKSMATLPIALITDAGHTEFHGVPTLTCLCIGPADSDDIDKITGHLKLL